MTPKIINKPPALEEKNKINNGSDEYKIEFIAGMQGTTNMTIDQYNDNGKLFSYLTQVDSQGNNYTGWEFFTNREEAHEHYSSIIPFNTKITVEEKEIITFTSDLTTVYANSNIDIRGNTDYAKRTTYCSRKTSRRTTCKRQSRTLCN